MERAPLGFCLSFAPRRGRRRCTSGRGRALSTSPELRLRYSSNLQSTCSLICVRPRVADPSGLPLACGSLMDRHLSGFPRASNPPTGAERRTSGWGQAMSTDLSYAFDISRTSNLRVFSQRATSRRKLSPELRTPPTKSRRRTSRWGQANEHGPGTTRSTSHRLILRSVVHQVQGANQDADPVSAL